MGPQLQQLHSLGSSSDEVGLDDALMGRNSWVSVLLHQGEKIPFPYLKAIYWVRVQGKSVWVMEWRTECFCGLWISPPPRIRNSILEGNDGISAELLWRGQTGCTAPFHSTRACWWTQSALIKDLSTLRIKTVECEEHIINDCGQVRMLLLSFQLSLYSLPLKTSVRSFFFMCKVRSQL